MVELSEPRPDPETAARRFFEERGLTVERIETAGGKTPDFIVYGDRSSYLVEVKARKDDEQLRIEARDGSKPERVRSFAHDERVARIARKAYRQFRDFDPNHRHLWLLWMANLVELAPEVMFNQIISTLYGVRYAATDAETVSFACFYALPGAFERYPTIDGALVTDEEVTSCCVLTSSRLAEGRC